MCDAKLQSAIQEHIDESHRFDAEILDFIFGPVEGGQRVLPSGAKHKLDYLYEQAQNGGVRSRLTAIDRGLIVGVIAAIEVASRLL